MKKLSIFLLCLLMAAGCTQVDDTLKKVAVDDLEVTDVNIVVPSSGRTESTIVTTSYPWSVEGNDGWCKVVTRSGDAGTATILFDVEENETYEDRSMNFTIVSGGKRTVVEVWQKQKDAVLFDRQIFDNIKMEGDEIEIKVAANIDYNIKIDGPAQSWITKLSEATAPADNPFVGATVRFKIGQTEEWNEREGKIYFFKADDDRVYEMVRVFQVQHDKIVVDREQVMASMEGRQNVEVTLRSNVEYSAEVVNTTGDWLTWEPSSKANVYLLNIDPYPTPDTAPEGDLRTGYVEFADVNSNGYAKGTVEVRQINGELIYVVGSLDRELPIEGGVFDLIAEENIDDFELVIPNYAKSWISLAPDDGGTRAPMLHHVFKIKVEVNPEEMAQRTAEIYVRGRSALDPDVVMVSEKVTVRQDGRIVFANAVELLTQLQKDMNFRHNNWPIMPDSVINPNPTFQGFTPNPSTGVAVTSMNLPSGLVFEKSSKLPEYIGDLKDLTTITINANVKGELPKSIGALPNLTTMTINNVGRAANGGGGFSKIPREWGQLHKSLKTLSIEHNFTDSLNAGAITPGDVLDWVGDLESLETFTVKTTNYNCPMPESWKNLKNLKSLTIDGTGFTNLDALAGMESLTTLNIVSLPISDLPDLSKLTQLQTVKIDKCANITSVPQSLLNVASLKSLTISSYKVARIDDVDWSALVNLETLSIAGTSSNLGTLTGNLSSSMNSMMKLKTLTLNYNNLSGNLVDIFAGKNLTSLNLSNNPGLTGEIPASLGGSALSTAFSIDNTGITKIQDGALAGTTRTSLSIKNTQLASFPMDITTNTRITSITLSGNQISTPIPAVLGNRMNLVLIDFSNNQISGNLPDMSNWTTVTTLNLSNNQITGTLPSSLGSLEKITTLNLSNNQISGSIPAEIETMGSGLATTAMTTLDLSNNQLTGNLPSRFNRMFNIPATGVANGFRSIYLQNNQLSGSLPDFSHMILINLDLRNNNFTGAVPAGIVGGTGTTTTGTGAPIYSFEQKPVNGVLTPRDTYVLFLSGNNLSGPIPEALKTMIQAREAAGYTSPAQNWWDNIAPQQGGSLTRQ